jgi:hypothetical protein
MTLLCTASLLSMRELNTTILLPPKVVFCPTLVALAISSTWSTLETEFSVFVAATMLSHFTATLPWIPEDVMQVINLGYQS